MQPLLTGKYYEDPLKNKQLVRGAYHEFDMYIQGENLINASLLILAKQKLSTPDDLADIKLEYNKEIFVYPKEDGIRVKIIIPGEKTLALATRNTTLKYEIQIQPENGKNYSLGSGEFEVVLSAIQSYPLDFTELTGNWNRSVSWLGQSKKVNRLSGNFTNVRLWISGERKAVTRISGSWNKSINWTGSVNGITASEVNADWNKSLTWGGGIHQVVERSGNWGNVQNWSGIYRLDIGSAIEGSWSKVHSFSSNVLKAIARSRNWSNVQNWSGAIARVTGEARTGNWSKERNWVRGIEQVNKRTGNWSKEKNWVASVTKRDTYPMLRIMPLGDSMTSGNVNASRPEPTGYRLHLWNNFKGVRLIDMVGTLKNGSGFLDRDHSGYDGYTTTQIDGIINAALTTHDPDLIVIMVGTNDSNNSANTAAIYRSNLVTLINKIKAYDPNIIIVLQTLYPVKNDTTRNNRVSSYNTEIRSLVSSDSSLVLAEVAGLVDTNQYLDNLHPSDAAYAPGANEIFNVIQALPGSRFNRIRKRNNDQIRTGSWMRSVNVWNGKVSSTFKGTWTKNAGSWSSQVVKEVMASPINGGVFSNFNSWTGEEKLAVKIDKNWDYPIIWTGEYATGNILDSDVQTWMDNVTANGGTYDTTTVNALDTLIKEWKNNGTWDKLLQFNPCCGEDWKAAQVKLKHPVSTSVLETLVNHNATTYTKVNGWVGLQSTNAATQRYLKTDFSPFLQGCTPINFAIHFDTNSPKGSGTSSIWIMGITESATDQSDSTNTMIYEGGGNSTRGIINQSGTAAEANTTTVISNGLISAQYTNNTDFRSGIYLNGSLLATASNSPGVVRAFRGGEIYVQNRNRMHVSTAQQSTSRNCRGYFLTERITDFSNFVNPWNTFKAAIGR